MFRGTNINSFKKVTFYSSEIGSHVQLVNSHALEVTGSDGLASALLSDVLMHDHQGLYQVVICTCCVILFVLKFDFVPHVSL